MAERRKTDRRNVAETGSALEPAPFDRREPVEKRKNERRSMDRIPIEMWVEEQTGNALYFQRTTNISSGGLFFSQTIPHPVGTSVHVKFTLPGTRKPIEAEGEIVSATVGDKLGMGLKFLKLNEDVKKLLNGYIRKKRLKTS